MSGKRTYLRSFAGGRISPEMTGRVDDVRYQTGLKEARNFITLPHGPMRNRPGFRYVANTKSNGKARLLKFQFSVLDQLIIEMGAGYFRFFDNDGPVSIGAYTAVPWMYGSTITSMAVGSSLSNIQIFSPSPFNQPGVGDKVRLYASSGSFVSPFQIGVTYYVSQSGVGGGGIGILQLATYPGGPSISWTGVATLPSNPVVSRYFEIGEVVSYGGTDYICVRDHEARELVSPTDTPATATDYWAPLTAGGVLEVTNPYAEEHLFEINVQGSHDVITLVHRSYPIYELRRYGEFAWIMQQVSLGPTLPAPANPSATVGSYGDTFRCLVSADGSSNPSTGEITPARWRVVANGDCTLVGGTTIILSGITTSGGSPLGMVIPDAGEYVVDNINGTDFDLRRTRDHNGLLAHRAGGVIAANVRAAPLSTEKENYYVITAVDRDGNESQASDVVSVLDNNLLVDGAWNRITWTAVEGADYYLVYKKQSGVYGFIAKVDADQGTELKDDNIDPELDKTPPVFDTSLSGTDYPGAVATHQERRAFGGTSGFPQQVWMTRTGAYADLSYSLPSKADDSLSFELATHEACTIMHLVAVHQLVALTNSSEFVIRSPQDSALTPDSIEAVVQSFIGANYVSPLVVSNVVVFCSTSGHVHGLVYQSNAQGFVPADFSLRCADLFDGFDLVDATYCRAPYPITWFVSSTGDILGLTIVPDQDVLGWHQHTTAASGVVESVAHMRDGNEDVLWAVIRRTINSGTVRYVERLGKLIESDLEQMVFADAAKTITGAPTLTGVQSGFSHLRGESVWVVADGIVLGQQTVNSLGEIDLGTGSYARVTVGLPIDAVAETLPVSVQIDGYGQGREKNVTRVTLRTINSGPFKLGPAADDLAHSDPYAPVVQGSLAAVDLTSSPVDMLIPMDWGDDGTVALVQPWPLPLTISGMTLEVLYGG